jgi:hypothetical protein
MNLPVTRTLPPYVSYRTFWNFLEGLKAAIPSRIDRSFWGDRFSGSTGAQLVAALKYLKLIDANGVPTLRLRQIVFAVGAQRADLLRQLAHEAYPFFLESLDPASATYSQLEEKLRENFPVTGDVSRKCIKFFIGICEESGISLSTFITRKSKATRAGGSRKTRRSLPENSSIRPDPVPEQVSESPYPPPQPSAKTATSPDLNRLLLEKLPAFDPEWSDEVKLKWLESFDKLNQQLSDQR